MNFKILQNIFIGFAFSCLIVLVGNSLFIYPSSDDFAYYIGQNEKGFWEFQKWHYFNWGGRYIPNAILGSFSFEGKGLWLYRGISILMIIGLFLSMLTFTKKVLKINDNRREAWYITSITFIVYLLSTYSLSQLFYWLPGSITYNLGIICNLLIWSYIKDVHKNRRIFLGTFLGIFILNGTNEISMLLFNVSIFFIILFETIKTGKPNIEKIILLGFSVFLFLFAVLAPGNSIRAESMNFPNTKDFIFTLTRSINRSVIFLIEQFYVVIFAVIALIPYLDKSPSLKINIPSKLSVIIKYSCILLPIFVLVIGNFPSYWATGRIPPQRTANVIGFFFLFSSLFSLIFYHSNFSLPKINSNVKYSVPVLIWISFLLLPNFLFINISDLLSGKTYLFQQKMEERIKFIKNSPLEDIEVPPIPIPKGVIAKELEEDKNHYYNQAFSKYYKKNSITLKK